MGGGGGHPATSRRISALAFFMASMYVLKLYQIYCRSVTGGVVLHEKAPPRNPPRTHMPHRSETPPVLQIQKRHIIPTTLTELEGLEQHPYNKHHTSKPSTQGFCNDRTYITGCSVF